MSHRPLFVHDTLTAQHETCALGHSICNERLECVEARIGDHGPCIDDIFALVRGQAKACFVKCASAAQSGDARLDKRCEVVLHAVWYEEPLNANAVLAHGLEACAHEHGRKERKVCAWQNQSWILAAQLERGGRQLWRSCLGDATTDRVTADECDVSEAGVARKCLDGHGSTCDQLYDIPRSATGIEAPVYAFEDVPRRPNDVLGAFDHDSVARKHGGDNGPQHVVHGVVPRHTGSYYSQRLVIHGASLVCQ